MPGVHTEAAVLFPAEWTLAGVNKRQAPAILQAKGRNSREALDTVSPAIHCGNANERSLQALALLFHKFQLMKIITHFSIF